MDDLEATIKRLEECARPSRELADEVLMACGWTRTEHGSWRTSGGELWGFKRAGLDPLTSVDAARTIIPLGASAWSCGQVDADFMGDVEFPVDVDGFHDFHGKSKANAAIALSIAALRSRSIHTDGGSK